MIPEVFSGSAHNAYPPKINFTETLAAIDIFVWDHDMYFKYTDDGRAWSDDMEIPANSFYSFVTDIISFSVRNVTPDSVARYQIIGRK